MEKTKLIIFDLGRTLYDVDNKRLFTDTIKTLEYLYKKYDLVIVALATAGQSKIIERLEIIKENNLEKYFKEILFSIDNKDALYAKVLNKSNLKPEEILIVDDRVVRGIKFGNNVGTKTCWVQNGKFSLELPTKGTKYPDFTIKSIGELLELNL